MKTLALAPSFGLEIHGLRLQSLRSPADWAEFKALLHGAQVLVVRDQQLSFDELKHINRQLGEPDSQYPPEYRLAGHPEIFVISNLVEDGKRVGSTTNGRDWHTDAIYAERPNEFTMLYTVEAPRTGGATMFANMFDAYEALPEATKQRLQGLRCRHSYVQAYSLRRGERPQFSDDQLRALFPDVAHPIVRTHPVTGRKGLFIGRTTAIGIEGPEGTQGAAGAADRTLIDELLAHAVESRFTLAHHARPGDFIVWDNAGLMHTATAYDEVNDRRLVYRMLTQGSRPF
jgi:taurine dioxygenase